MPRRGRPHEQPQPRSVFHSQLKPPEDTVRDFVDPAQRGSDPRTGERLFEGPDRFLVMARADDNRAIEIDPEACCRRRIKLPPIVDHHQRPAGLQSL